MAKKEVVMCDICDYQRAVTKCTLCKKDLCWAHGKDIYIKVVTDTPSLTLSIQDLGYVNVVDKDGRTERKVVKSVGVISCYPCFKKLVHTVENPKKVDWGNKEQKEEMLLKRVPLTKQWIKVLQTFVAAENL